MMADWLMQRPADALSKFTMFLLKEILDDPQAHFGGSHKNSKSTAPPPQKAKVRIFFDLPCYFVKLSRTFSLIG